MVHDLQHQNVPSVNPFHVTPDMAWKMKNLATKAGGMVRLRKRSFCVAAMTTFEFQERGHFSLYLNQLQRDIARFEPTVVVGFDPNTDKVMWYVVKDKPYTPVPFVFDPQEKPEQETSALDQVRRDRFNEEVLRRAESIRIAKGVPLNHNHRAWYLRQATTVPELLKDYIPEARRRLKAEEKAEFGE